MFVNIGETGKAAACSVAQSYAVYEKPDNRTIVLITTGGKVSYHKSIVIY